MIVARAHCKAHGIAGDSGVAGAAQRSVSARYGQVAAVRVRMTLAKERHAFRAIACTAIAAR